VDHFISLNSALALEQIVDADCVPQPMRTALVGSGLILQYVVDQAMDVDFVPLGIALIPTCCLVLAQEQTMDADPVVPRGVLIINFGSVLIHVLLPIMDVRRVPGKIALLENGMTLQYVEKVTVM